MDNQQQNDKQPADMNENTSANVKSITNIYYDCLERIFDFLDLESLLNVANTCKRLQTAAAVKFGDAYGQRTAFLNNADWCQQGIQLFGCYIRVRGVKFCFPFLRCFGAKISKLTIMYDEHELGANDYVDQYINQYCAKTLKTISLYSAPRFSIGNLPNPFECVEEVSIYNVNLAAQLPHFVHVFPKLRALKLDNVTVDINHTNVKFPKLEKLCIRFNSRQKVFTMNLLHANPQLQEFTLQMDMSSHLTMPELLNLISRNPSITNLKILNYNETNINLADLMRFASERPYMVELDVWTSQITPQDAITFIRQLKPLKLFRFSINDQIDYDQLVGQLDSEWKHEHTIYPSGIHVILKR